MEYERQVGGAAAAADGAPVPPAAAALPQRTMSFGTVMLKTTDAKTGAARDANVAEMLLVRGLASVVRHRTCGVIAGPMSIALLQNLKVMPCGFVSLMPQVQFCLCCGPPWRPSTHGALNPARAANVRWFGHNIAEFS